MPQSLIPQSSARTPRPGYLVACLVLASMLGLGGLTNGCGTIQFYRQATHAGLTSDSKMDPELRAWVEHVHQARNEGLVTYAGRIVPLATANALLSFLLIVASATALAGRPRANSLALQATAANLAYTVIDFVLERPLRTVIIEAATRAPPGIPALAERLPSAMGWWWMYRGLFVLQLAALAAIIYGLTRPRVAAIYGADDDPEQDG
ncbi:MAG: hypothetical protein HY898_35870 [Deltaproteobacteria bacterium]|nr:hypothetical protein [Deltaproteobacteria bacterium]